MTIAVLADVHGNRWALDAVLDDARAAGAETFVNLGDCAFGPLDPGGAVERLMALGGLTVRGNHDRLDATGAPGDTGEFVFGELSVEQRRWLGDLPTTERLDGMLLCHGSPASDLTYLLEEVTPTGARRRAPAAVARELGDVDADVVLCGHTHLPRVLPLPGGPLVVNPGSVGLPAFADDVPFLHVIEAGSPHARYALLRRGPRGWAVELRTVDYRADLAAAAARANGRDDWAVALETGLAATTIAATGQDDGGPAPGRSPGRTIPAS